MPIFTLKQLIRGAVHRAHVTRQVSALEIVRFMNDTLRRLLPNGSGANVKAISYKEGIVCICALNASVRHVVLSLETELLQKLRVAFPEKPFTKLSLRINKRFPNEDI